MWVYIVLSLGSLLAFAITIGVIAAIAMTVYKWLTKKR